jgi:hypothetical protein
MIDTGDVGFTFSEAIKAILVGLASIAIWLLKKLGEQHIVSINSLNGKIDKLIEKMEMLSERVTVVEVRMKHVEDTNQTKK